MMLFLVFQGSNLLATFDDYTKAEAYVDDHPGMKMKIVESWQDSEAEMNHFLYSNFF